MSKNLIRRIHPFSGILVISFFVLELIVALEGGGRGFMIPNGFSLTQTLICFPCGILGFVFYPASIISYGLFYVACGLNFVIIDRLIKFFCPIKERNEIE